MILANTFFKTEEVATDERVGEAAGVARTTVDDRPKRIYLLSDLKDHDLWKEPR